MFLLSGGVVGTAIILVSAFWFFIRRRPYFAVSQERPVNVLQDDEDRIGEYHWLSLSQNYVAEPFLVSDPTTRGMPEPASTHDRPLSKSTLTADGQRPQTPTTPMTTSSKSASFPPLRPVNIIQHDDASPGEDLSGQAGPETIELPPAYSSYRQPQCPPLASSTPTGDRRRL